MPDESVCFVLFVRFVDVVVVLFYFILFCFVLFFVFVFFFSIFYFFFFSRYDPLIVEIDNLQYGLQENMANVLKGIRSLKIEKKKSNRLSFDCINNQHTAGNSTPETAC